jgi:hypothetical protein
MNTYKWSVYQLSKNANDPANGMAFFNVLHQSDTTPCHVSGSCKVDLTDADNMSKEEIVKLVKQSLGSQAVAEYESKLAENLT